MKKQLLLSNRQLHVFFFGNQFFPHGVQRAAFFLLSMICALSLFGAARPALALQPEQVLVLVNTRMVGSLALAKYYMRQRGIPESNLLEMSLTFNETISREDYNDYIIPKVRKKLEKLAPQPIGALVTFYGMPLKIAQTPATEEEKQEIASINKKIAEYEKQLESAPGLRKNIDALRQRLNAMATETDSAAVDSELMLVRADGYKLKGWIANPYFLEFKNKKTSVDKSQVLLVSRLDGPDLETVRRMIDDAIAAEKKGLQGIAYLDARYPPPQGQPDNAYGFYDAALHEAKKILEKKMPVVLDEKDELFPPNSCPNAALYCGWYSYGRYIDSFTWKPGAVGYHIASGECATLRLGNKANPYPWCPGILGHGAAATIGPVSEPYLTAFPPPHLFFALLTSGKLTLGETYLASLPYLSWQMILVGDPLYLPFSQKMGK